jgi:hypothetical protein
VLKYHGSSHARSLLARIRVLESQRVATHETVKTGISE